MTTTIGIAPVPGVDSWIKLIETSSLGFLHSVTPLQCNMLPFSRIARCTAQRDVFVLPGNCWFGAK